MRYLILAASLMLAPYSAHAVILQVSGGQLTGATGVNVNGTLYDVTFQDGTCIDLFTGCDNAAEDFAFITYDSAQAAAQALLAQVLLDVPSGNFDSEPSSTSGCTASSGLCVFDIPFRLTSGPVYNLGAVEAYNSVDESFDFVGIGGIQYSVGRDLTVAEGRVFARFTPSAPVPEPATLALMGMGLAGLGFSRRQRKHTARGL